MPELGMLPVQGGFAAINSALSEVDRKDVRGIGISGQQHGFVPMDGDGQVDICHGMPFCNSCLCTASPVILNAVRPGWLTAGML